MKGGKSSRILIRETMRTLLFDFSYVCIAVMTGLRYGVYAAVQSLWAGPFLIVYLGLPTATAGYLLLLLNIGFIFGGPAGGVLSDRLIRRPKRIMLASLVFMAVCVTALARYPGPVNIPVLAGILFVFGFFGGFGHIGFAHIKALISPQMSGRAFAIANCCSMLGGGLFLQGLGSLLNRESSAGLAAGADYPLAFMLCAAALGVSVIIYLFSRDPLVNDPKPVASMSN
jgi:MFS family permease